MSTIRILNHHQDGSQEAMSNVETKQYAAELRSTLFTLFAKHLDEKDGTINYITLSKTQEFRDFIEKTKLLTACQPKHLSDIEKKAFFINLYNVLTIHALANIHSTKAAGEKIESPCSIPDFWNSFAYNIGGMNFTLDSIEHGVLRGNRVHPTSQQKSFSLDDPRIQLSLKDVDPRIHFALNCGAMSCPMARVYSEENLDEKLDAATRYYLTEEVFIEMKDGRIGITLPKILEWYAVDFGSSTEDVLRWIVRYMEGNNQDTLSKIIEKKDFSAVDMSYEYDWSVNHKET